MGIFVTQPALSSPSKLKRLSETRLKAALQIAKHSLVWTGCCSFFVHLMSVFFCCLCRVYVSRTWGFTDKTEILDATRCRRHVPLPMLPQATAKPLFVCLYTLLEAWRGILRRVWCTSDCRCHARSGRSLSFAVRRLFKSVSLVSEGNYKTESRQYDTVDANTLSDRFRDLVRHGTAKQPNFTTRVSSPEWALSTAPAAFVAAFDSKRF